MKNKISEKELNQKFIYSKEADKVIVDFVTDDLKRRQAERKQFEKTWELNINYYLGNQYCYLSETGDVSDVEKKYFWENREVYNHIAPIIETRLAKLAKVKPNFSVKPLSNTEEDLYTSKLAKTILLNTCENSDLNDLMIEANYWSEITGTAFYKVTWNETKNGIVVDDKGQSYPSGDVEISICSPFEIFPDSNGAVNIEDCNSIIHARACPVDFVNQVYGVNLTGEPIDTFSLGLSTISSGLSGRSNITKVSHSKKYNHVLLIERYEKPSDTFPNGRFTIVAKDKLLYDGDLPYNIGNHCLKGFPFIKQVSLKRIGCFWGSSVIERCIPIQRAYNSIKNKKHEFIERIASGVLAVEDGSVDIDNLEDEGLAPGKILIYRNGSNPPKFLETGTIPSELISEEERLLEELRSCSSVSDISTNSSISSNITSGTALSLLITQDESRLALIAEEIRSSIKKVARYVLRLYKQFATTGRFSQILDNNGVLQVYYWSNKNITSDNVFLESNNELEEPLAETKTLLLSLLEKGILSDDDGKISSANKTKILSYLGINNWEVSDDLGELHKARAQKENINFEKLTDPLEIDNHNIHINEHTKYLISDESRDLSEEARKQLIEHIQKHKSML